MGQARWPISQTPYLKGFILVKLCREEVRKGSFDSVYTGEVVVRAVDHPK
ncbi:hypothetical protein BH09ACT6_BH09ACT6_15390 [soil metagenome]